MKEKLICPVCGKTVFGQLSNNDICKYCGWENDNYYEEGGANELCLADYIKRYNNYIELNSKYIWKNDGFPEISIRDEYQLAHKYSLYNEEIVLKSKKCGCFFCFKIFNPEEITEWISDKYGRTAVCPYCKVDSVLPDAVISFDHIFLEGMYDLWFN